MQENRWHVPSHSRIRCRPSQRHQQIALPRIQAEDEALSVQMLLIFLGCKHQLSRHTHPPLWSGIADRLAVNTQDPKA